MITRNFLPLVALVSALALTTNSAFAVTPFTETFDTSASGWLDGDSLAPTFNATGGIGDSGYISFLAPTFNSGSGGFGDPLKIMFRGNNSANASGDAFVGDWLAGDIGLLSFAVRHNYASTLNLYARIDAGSGRAGSLANTLLYSIAPNTWTTIEIPVEDGNPPFASYGAAGTGLPGFNAVFSGVQNVQVGLYLPGNTDIAGLRLDLDNVTIAVPEVSSLAMIGMGLGTLATTVLWKRRRSA